MLKYSFIQFPGVGDKTEEKLWKDGILTWADYQALPKPPVTPRLHGKIATGILDSQKALDQRDIAYFRECFPKEELWRLYADFLAETAFVAVVGSSDDAATADLLAASVTTVEGTTLFRKGQNLDELAAFLKPYRMIGSFAGENYDLPLLGRFVADLGEGRVLLEVRSALKRLGYTGGAVSIEKALGMLPMEAPEELPVEELAVLYLAGENGSSIARQRFETLLYHDSSALKPLMDFAHARLWEEVLPESTSNVPLPKLPEKGTRRPPAPPEPIVLTQAAAPAPRRGRPPRNAQPAAPKVLPQEIEPQGEGSGRRRRRR